MTSTVTTTTPSEVAPVADPGTAEPSAAAAFKPRPDPFYHAVLLGLCGAVLVLAAVLSIRGQTQVLLPILNQPLPELCTFRRLTGIGCPGCGMTRCFISLAHGDVRSAWSYNPAGLLLFALFAVQIPYRTVQLWRIRRGQPELRVSRLAQWTLALFALALFGQWILRQCGLSF